MFGRKALQKQIDELVTRIYYLEQKTGNLESLSVIDVSPGGMPVSMAPYFIQTRTNVKELVIKLFEYLGLRVVYKDPQPGSVFIEELEKHIKDKVTKGDG